MSNQIAKYLKLYRYDEDVHEAVPYELPIYAIPLTKKGFCQATTFINIRGEEKEIGKCQNFNKRDKCSECVQLARKLYKENH